jgi:hypothetical protein
MGDHCSYSFNLHELPSLQSNTGPRDIWHDLNIFQVSAKPVRNHQLYIANIILNQPGSPLRCIHFQQSIHASLLYQSLHLKLRMRCINCDKFYWAIPTHSIRIIAYDIEFIIATPLSTVSALIRCIC